MHIRLHFPTTVQRVVSVCALAMLACTASAIEQFQLSFATVESADWRLGESSLQLDWTDPQNPLLLADIDYLVFAAERIDKIRIVCSRFDLRLDQVSCRAGRLSFASARLSASDVPVTFRYRYASRQLDVKVSKLVLAGGQIDLAFQQAQQAWQLDVDIRRAGLAEIGRLLKEFSPGIAAFSYQGVISGRLDIDGGPGGFERVAWQLQTGQAGYANPAGDQAAEALRIASTGTARIRGQRDWVVQANLDADQGMLFSDPVYLEFSKQQALSLATDLHWQAASQNLLIKSLRVKQPQVVDAGFSGQLQPQATEPLHALTVNIRQAQLPGLYTNWLQPWLTGSALGALDARGTLSGNIRLAEGRTRSVDLALSDISLAERSGQFGIEKLNGRLAWDSSGPPQTNRLSWHSGNLYRVQFGAADVVLDVATAGVALQAPLAIPLFDGELRVDVFTLTRQEGRVDWLLDGMLTPVSMQTLSAAFDWPPFSGKLSGMFPRVRYQQGELTLGGVLLVQAFDGDITLRNLRIQEPLGLVPRLWVDARLEHLDLKPLTNAFSFGRIEGQLQGRVDGLYMEAWQPVSFDAVFRTPPDDRSRHRISQRAVDTISDLGGAGMAGALSRSFLRFLEDFPYQAIGIRCRLENEVCHMGGVADAPNGYYLVKGTFLPPRLDVVGYASEVDWPSLVGRLKAATKGGAPALE